MASQPSWDLGRFMNTLTFFDVLPFSDQLRQMQRWMQGNSPESMEVTPLHQQPGWILLAGLPAPVRSPLLAALNQQGWPVRVLTWEAGDLVASSPSLEQAGADAPIDAVLSNCRCLVLGSELEPQRLQDLIEAWCLRPARVIFDFRYPTEDLKHLWGAVDDVVMGGVSQSALQVIEGMALFAGTVSTANSGGFASIRTRNFEQPLDLSAYEGVQLQVRGDGKRYKLFLRTATAWDSVAYGSSFDTEAGQWLNLRLPFVDMMPVFRAKIVEDADPLDPAQIRAVQVMLSKFEFDKQLNPRFSPGPFTLQLGLLGAYGGPVRLNTILIRSSGTDRPMETMAEQLTAHALPYRTLTLLETEATPEFPSSAQDEYRSPADLVETCLQILRHN